MQVFEGVLGGVKDRSGALSQGGRDDGFDDEDGEEKGLCSQLRPDDGRCNGCDGEQEREPAKPWVGELIGGLGPSSERLPVDADFEVFAEDSDVFAKIEMPSKLGDGRVALLDLCDWRWSQEPCGKSVFAHAGAGEGEEFEETALPEEVEVGGVERSEEHTSELQSPA